jgi:hypothetical protein
MKNKYFHSFSKFYLKKNLIAIFVGGSIKKQRHNHIFCVSVKFQMIKVWSLTLGKHFMEQSNYDLDYVMKDTVLHKRYGTAAGIK